MRLPLEINLNIIDASLPEGRQKENGLEEIGLHQAIGSGRMNPS
jgi:hypothetical protein